MDPRLLNILLFIPIVVSMAVGASNVAQTANPILYQGNPSCEDLGFAEGLKIDDPNATGTYPLDSGEVTWDKDMDGYITWSSTIGVDAVIVKGGPNANVYLYIPEDFGDSDLIPPTNPNNGDPYSLSHIEFCYDYEYGVEVTKDAITSFTRTYTWGIKKSVDPDHWDLITGESGSSDYTVEVERYEDDSAWAVAGTINIYNPDPANSAQITGVSDTISLGLAAQVDCGVDFPYELLPLDTLVCTYSSELPDGSDRDNTATVFVSEESMVGGGTGTADVIFGEPTNTVGYSSVNVEDTNGLSWTFNDDGIETYSRTFTCDEDQGTHTNIATILETDLSDDATMTVTCNPPPTGCTLTQGYWKTHSEHGPAPYDETWAMLPDGADTVFYLSEQSYYEVLWTPPKGGNAYYILAKQFIAAELNQLNGASSTTEVNAAMDWAEAFFNLYKPNDPLSKDERQEAIDYAELLDHYNNGLIGPGHCSE